MSVNTNTSQENPIEKSGYNLLAGISLISPLLNLFNKFSKQHEIDTLVKSQEYIKFINLQQNLTHDERFKIIAKNLIAQELTEQFSNILDIHKDVFDDNKENNKENNKDKVFKYLAMTYKELIDKYPIYKLNKEKKDKKDEEFIVNFINELEALTDTSKITSYQELQSECIDQVCSKLELGEHIICKENNDAASFITTCIKSFEGENINKKRKLENKEDTEDKVNKKNKK